MVGEHRKYIRFRKKKIKGKVLLFGIRRKKGKRGGRTELITIKKTGKKK